MIFFKYKCDGYRERYRVINKSLRDFRTRLRNNQDRHGRKEHIMGPWARTACSFRSAQAATLLEFMYHSRIVLSVGGSMWYMIRNLRCKSQLTQFWQIPRHRMLSYSLWTPFFFTTTPYRSWGTWKYAKTPSTKENLERFSTYWYVRFCRVCLGCCAVEFGNPGGTYE